MDKNIKKSVKETIKACEKALKSDDVKEAVDAAHDLVKTLLNKKK